VGGAGIALLSATLIRDDLDTGRLIKIPGLVQGGWVELSVACQKEPAPSRAVIEIIETAKRVSTLASEPEGDS
jgi:DNA-binding transcriptional LysR family regulator